VSTSRPSTLRQHPRRGVSIWLWSAFSLCAFAGIAAFLIPTFIIRPFRYEAPGALLVAMALRQRAPFATLLTAVACFALALALWRTVGRWRKSVLVLVLLVVTFSAVMARLNYFEWMFHPIADPQFLAQSESKLDPKEMVLSIHLGDDARAYPISQMAYHHVLNDVVAGVPIAVTY
jgi:uncharacterized protein DUF3179